MQSPRAQAPSPAGSPGAVHSPADALRVTDLIADALVVGAGPAGSASAALLADAGWRVLAIDRATFPREKPCSEYMSPEAVRTVSYTHLRAHETPEHLVCRL